MKTCAGSPSIYTFIQGACGPGPPAIYSSNPQYPQNHFQCNGNGGLFDFYSKGCIQTAAFKQLLSNSCIRTNNVQPLFQLFKVQLMNFSYYRMRNFVLRICSLAKGPPELCAIWCTTTNILQMPSSEGSCNLWTDFLTIQMWLFAWKPQNACSLCRVCFQLSKEQIFYGYKLHTVDKILSGYQVFSNKELDSKV